MFVIFRTNTIRGYYQLKKNSKMVSSSSRPLAKPSHTWIPQLLGQWASILLVSAVLLLPLDVGVDLGPSSEASPLRVGTFGLTRKRWNFWLESSQKKTTNQLTSYENSYVPMTPRELLRWKDWILLVFLGKANRLVEYIEGACGLVGSCSLWSLAQLRSCQFHTIPSLKVTILLTPKNH